MFSQKQQKQAAKLSLPPWSANLLALIIEKTKKIPCFNSHISPGEKSKLSKLGKRKCSHKLRNAYYRKCDNSNFSFNQFPPGKKTNNFYEEYLPLAN